MWKRDGGRKKRVWDGNEDEKMTHREVLREAFDTLAFAGLLAVELLRVELLVQPEGLDLSVQTG